MNDFSKKTIAALAKKGIRLIGLTVIPNTKSDMPLLLANMGIAWMTMVVIVCGP